MYFTKTLLATLFSATLSAGLSVPTITKRSPQPALEKGKYVVSRQAEFDNHVSWTFEGGSLPEGLTASNYGAGETREFIPDNAIVRGGYLELLVNGGQTAMPYTCGEVVTNVENIKFASVRTVAILTEPAGVCNGECLFSQYLNSTNAPRNVFLPIGHTGDRH